MENQHFLDEEYIKPQNERPTFLTVLCIITFVVSGIMLIYSLFGAVTYDEESQRAAIEMMVENMEESSEQLENTAFANMGSSMQIMAEEEIENHGTLTLLSFLSIILSLLGAFLMFNMKKLGFHLYLSSKVIGFVPLTIFTLSMPIVATYVVIGVLVLAFVIMYGVNLKHMK